jgi:hypothetical protein
VHRHRVFMGQRGSTCPVRRYGFQLTQGAGMASVESNTTGHTVPGTFCSSIAHIARVHLPSVMLPSLAHQQTHRIPSALIHCFRRSLWAVRTPDVLCCSSFSSPLPPSFPPYRPTPTPTPTRPHMHTCLGSICGSGRLGPVALRSDLCSVVSLPRICSNTTSSWAGVSVWEIGLRRAQHTC